MGNIVEMYVNVSFSPTKVKVNSSLKQDNIQEYAKETLSLGLLLMEFKDAVKEGDGMRVLRCWKYFLLIFRATGHTNYCIEAMNLLTQYYYTLTPQLAQQMLWGRFINNHGKIGQNISCDLHMEHLNRLCKTAVNHLGANKTPQAISRIGKALGPVSNALSIFDGAVDKKLSGSHTRCSQHDDLCKVVQELVTCNVFSYIPGRKHSCFPRMMCNGMLNGINRAKLGHWMKEKLKHFLDESIVCK